MSFEKMSKDFQTTEQDLRDKNTKYNELSDRFEKTSHEIASMRLEMSAPTANNSDVKGPHSH